MSSYCPICEQFVDNLDDCELPYDGKPPPLYDDEICVIEYEGQIYSVETDPDSHLIFRKNVLVEEYERIYDWLIMVSELGTNNILFYFVKVRNDAGQLKWLQVSPEFAETRFYC